MVATGVWLGVLGLCDLLRAARDVTSTRRRAVLVVLALSLLVVAAGALGRNSLVVGSGGAGAFAVLLACWAGGATAWVLGSSASLHPSPRPARARTVAFAGLALGTVASLLLGGLMASPPPAWGGSLASLADDVLGASGELALLTLGASLFLVASSNVAVRLLLDAVGVPAGVGERTLKGGRVLGPMERLFILVLGLLGGLDVAFVVVAAKGLLRFPELRTAPGDAEGDGPSELTEYFLIGSFASWLLALAVVALLTVARHTSGQG